MEQVFKPPQIPDRPIGAGKLIVPAQIRLEGGGLVWCYDGARERIPGTGPMLSGFSELHQADDEAILEYARQWGVIGFCSHGLPASHYPILGSTCEPVRAFPDSLDPPLFEKIWWFDDLNHWRRWSRKFSMAWTIGIRLVNGKRVPAAEWEQLGRAPFGGMSGPETLAFNISEWARAYGNLCPELEWERTNGRWLINITSRGAGNLFGYLVCALMPAIGEKDGYAHCSICRNPYVPSRRPADNRANYCLRAECQRAKWRDYKRKAKKP